MIGRDPRFQVLARFTGATSAAEGDLQIAMVTHADLTAEPAVQVEAGVQVVAVLLVGLMLPASAGRLRLRDKNPASPPHLDLSFCEREEDTTRLVDGLRRAWEVVSSHAMSRAFRRVVRLTDEIVGEDELLERYVLATVRSYCHALGTAPMGPDPGSGAVVDESGAVHGVDGLFVIDASIFPTVPRVVPNLTVMMVAERLSHQLQSR